MTTHDQRRHSVIVDNAWKIACTEAELWAAFEAERPRILGVLLDAMVKGPRMLPHTRLDKLAADG
jgi:hypothetical protein